MQIIDFHEWCKQQNFTEFKIGWKTDPSEWGPEVRTPEDAMRFLDKFEPGHMNSTLNAGGGDTSLWSLAQRFGQSPLVQSNPQLAAGVEQLASMANDYQDAWNSGNTHAMQTHADKMSPFVEKLKQMARNVDAVPDRSFARGWGR
jgi:hypothetical protein